MQTRTYRNNRGLFSTGYLDERLTETEAWNALIESELRAVREELIALREQISEDSGEFIRGVFRALGIRFGTDEGEPTEYVFFGADRHGDTPIVAVADTERWDRIHARLHATQIDWAVYTNGNQWRLYHDAVGHRVDAYYEIDLPALLETGHIEPFKRFYLFFRHEAFIKDEDGNCFLDDIYEESTSFSEELRDELTDNVYEAISVLAGGLLENADTDVDLGLVRDSTLVYLYRLIVVLYAEAGGRGPLETDTVWYRNHSVSSLKRTITDESGRSGGGCCGRHDSHWSRLSSLFDQIDESGYSGWLFQSAPEGGDHPRPETRFLSRSRVDDDTLERVIELLTQRQPGGEETSWIDYSSLSVRHLGHIHETLLECELHVPEETAGEPSLTTDSRKRNAAGTYYTPEQIVEYIVANTLDPVVADVRSPDDRAAVTRRVFELRILDPAMGSGYFLTAALSHLTREIIAVQGHDSGVVPAIDRIRRQIAQHCLYGVDRDPLAVELGKASIWLWTATDQPLVLDRHLKTGNALVGETEPVDGVFEQTPPHDRLRAISNVKTAEAAGLDCPPDADERMVAAVATEQKWAALEQTSWFQTAQQRARRDQYFHWPLEFEQLYREDGRFDAVIGNPPYVRDRNLSESHKEFYKTRYRTADGAYDLYSLFVELAAELGRRCSFIIPNKWTTTSYGKSLRELLLDECTLCELVDVSRYAVFPDAGVYPLIVTYTHDSTTETVTVRRGVGAAAIDESADSVTVSRRLIDQLGGVIPMDLTPSFIPILEKALAQETTLGEHVVLHESIHTGNVREKLVVEDNVGVSCEKLADGSSVRRYHAGWSGEWIRYDDSLIESSSEEYANLRERGLFDREKKLLIRDISDRPVAAYDDSGLFALNTVYSATRRPDTGLSLKYLLAIFNSEFVDRYFRQVYGGTHVSGDYLRFKPMFTHTIPIPLPDNRALPEERKRRLRAFDPELDTTSVGRTLSQLTDSIRNAIEAKQSQNPTPTELLSGPQQPLTRVSGYQSAVGSDSPLTATANELEGLRIGSVEIEDKTNSLTIHATARHKPDGNVDETDQWGYTETELLPAIEFLGLSDTERFLVREIVQHAVNTREGIAGFRARATQTNSLLDRLKAITVPVLDRTQSGVLNRYRARVRTANELEERIQTTDRFIDEIVYDLYGLTAEEKQIVRSFD